MEAWNRSGALRDCGIVEVFSLTQGDVRWVFPDLAEPGVVRDALSEADARMRSLADHLGVRAGRSGGGLEYHREQGYVLAGVFGLVEASGVMFTADLCFPRRCLWDLRWGPPWQVEAQVMVWCEAPEDDRGDDCGGEFVAEWTARSYDDPAEAADGLVQAAAWLFGQGVGEELSVWRTRGMHCRHSPVAHNPVE